MSLLSSAYVPHDGQGQPNSSLMNVPQLHHPTPQYQQHFQAPLHTPPHTGHSPSTLQNPQPQHQSHQSQSSYAGPSQNHTTSAPIVVQPGEDWAKSLVKLAKTAELKKHSLTLQLHTAHIISSHAALEKTNKTLEDVRAQKNWLESERAHLLDQLRQINEDREKADLLESSVLKQVEEQRNKIQMISEGEYAVAKREVDILRNELGMSPVRSLQSALDEKSAAYLTQRRLEQQPPQIPPVPNGGQLTNNSETTPTNSQKRGPNGPPNSNVDSEPPAKRPRGRPKGSKNKVKTVAPAGDSTS